MIFLGGLLVGCTQEIPDDPVSPRIEGTADHFLSAEKAVEIAEAYVSDARGETRNGALKVSDIQVFGAKPTRSEQCDDNVLWGYYIVNFDEDSGFALVSADTRNMPVYAFSDEGNLNLADTIYNHGLKEYISGLPYALPDSENGETDLKGLASNGITPPNPDPNPNPSLETHTKEVAPLIYPTVRIWSQWAPFNKYCFTPDGQQSVVGCGPLSTGMIMSYYEYPTKYQNYTFDWSEIKRKHSSDDLARLLRVLGEPENLCAEYKVGATGVDRWGFLYTYENMGYKKPDYSSFMQNTVLRIIRGKNPIHVVGDNIIDGEPIGHAWVIDGLYTVASTLTVYDEPKITYSYYFHCVWGWGGHCNGYYSFANNKFSGEAKYLEEKDSQGFEESKEPIRGEEWNVWRIFYNFKRIDL